MAKLWTLDDGLRLVRLLQGEAKSYGYHITLGGGVLNKGESKKDLDLYFLPLENDEVAKGNPEELVKWLRGMWGEAERIGAAYDEPQQNQLVDWPQFEMFLGPDGRQQVRRVANFNPFVKATATVKLDAPTKFLHKLKFIRPDGDRIDVFIL